MDFGKQFKAENKKNKTTVVAISGSRSDLDKITELAKSNEISVSSALGNVVEQVAGNEKIIDSFLSKETKERTYTPSGLKLSVPSGKKEQKTVSLKPIYFDDIEKVKSMLKGRKLQIGAILGGLLLEYLVAYDEANKKKVGNEE